MEESTAAAANGIIREYLPQDFTSVSLLNQISYAAPCSDEELRGKIASGVTWVAVDDLVFGAIITCPVLDKTWIWSLTVAPAYQNKGWGNRLLEVAEEHYGHTLWLHSEPTGPANYLYTKRGYQTSQFLKGFYGENLDAVEMYK